MLLSVRRDFESGRLSFRLSGYVTEVKKRLFGKGTREKVYKNNFKIELDSLSIEANKNYSKIGFRMYERCSGGGAWGGHWVEWCVVDIFDHKYGMIRVQFEKFLEILYLRLPRPAQLNY